MSIIQEIATRPRIRLIQHEAELPEWLTVGALARFLHESLEPYEDELCHIQSALTPVLQDKPSRGGFVALATDETALLGATVIRYTPWSGYVPENLLLYVAVHPDHRGRGVGCALVEKALANCDGDVKLHVEHDNPAKCLYERLGFTSKYTEMRYSQ